MTRTLQERLTFDSGLRVGASPVRLVAPDGREVLAVVTIRRAGSRPRVTIRRGDALAAYIVAGDLLTPEGETRGGGRLDAFALAVASPVASVTL